MPFAPSPHKSGLKRFLPRSLFGRALLILVLPIVVLQGVVASVLMKRHYDGVTEQMADVVAHELEYLVGEIEAAPDLATAQRRIARISRLLGIEVSLDPNGRVQPRALLGFYDFTGGAIEETLKAGVTRPITLDLVSVPKTVEARLLTAKGVLSVSIPRRRLNPANPHQLIVFTSLVAIVLVVIAVIFLRNQVRPIRQLAYVATAFGRGRHLAFRPSGAEEVRRAGHAFLDMRTRIERQMQQRTAMLSGVSHDLRTPLTRMKLALAMADEGPETAEIGRDVAEMERMIESFLAFARGEAGEATEACDLLALVEEIALDAVRAGAALAFETRLEPAVSTTLIVRRQALKRAITNLVENARHYAEHAVLTLRMTRRSAEITVEDNGPGIPEDRREEMLRPFARLDPARTQTVSDAGGGGVGLGLTIALDIARGHGGALELDTSPTLGGLRATLRLPR
ncbi:MAG: ATP-binding protein [Pseudomonadota bacterium]